jgi:hypothetical protein
MIITRDIAKGQLIPLPFGQAAVTANQAAVALTYGAVASHITAVPLPWNYDIVGLSFDLSAAGTAGVFTIDPTIGGTAKTAGRITVGTAVSNYLRIPREVIRGSMGDLLGVKVTTNGSWDGTSSKLGVVLWVLAHLGGV